MDAHDNITDPVDELVGDALRKEMPPASERRMRAHLATLRNRIAAGRPKSFAGRILQMPRWARVVPIAAAALIVAAVGAYFLWTPRVAFAEVIEQVREARTLSFKMTSQVTLPSGQNQSTEGECLVMEPGLFRYEVNGTVMVMDGSKGKGLVLNEQTHTAMVMTMTGKAAAANPGASFLETLRALKDRAAETLGEREMDGHRAVGFRVDAGPAPVQGGLTAFGGCTLWADVQTGFPVRVEMTTEMMGMKVNAAMTDFVVNPPLDEALFDVTPPEGYTLVQIPVNAGPPTEADVAAGLGAYAEVTEGEFPAKFGPKATFQDVIGQVAAAAGKKLAGAGLGAGPASQQQAELMGKLADVSSKLMRAMLYLSALPANCDWHYAGAGAHLGDADKPICWWLPAGSVTYHVVYADLTEADLQAGDLPAE